MQILIKYDRKNGGARKQKRSKAKQMRELVLRMGAAVTHTHIH